MILSKQWVQTMQFLLALTFAVLAGRAQTDDPPPAVVKFSVVADLEAALELDGKPIGAVAAGQRTEWEAAPGEHRLVAYPATGATSAAAPWRKLVLVSAALPTQVVIPLKAHVLRGEIQQQGFWKDERTGLQWAGADNGSGVTVSQAHHYCRTLELAGAKDWRLPAIHELQALFGGPADDRGFRVIVPLKLSGWAWSSTEGNEPAENWALDFGDGSRASVVAGDSGLNRALCVRGREGGQEGHTRNTGTSRNP